MFFVTGQKRNDRLAICKSCEHFVQSTKSCGPLLTEAFTDSKLCGCHMPTKTRLKVASCELGKWEAEITPEDIDEIQRFLKTENQFRTNGQLAKLYAKATGTNQKPSSCSSCNRRMLEELQKLVNNANRWPQRKRESVSIHESMHDERSRKTRLPQRRPTLCGMC